MVQKCCLTLGWDTIGWDNISPDVQILGIDLSPVGEIIIIYQDCIYSYSLDVVNRFRVKHYKCTFTAREAQNYISPYRNMSKKDI